MLASWASGERLGVWFLIVSGTALQPSLAKERVTRRLDQRDGLPASTVCALAQDETGFLWIGTVGGLARYDGNEVRPWGREQVSGPIHQLAVGSGEEVIVRSGGTLHRVVAQSLEPVSGPDGKNLRALQSVTFASGGALWIAQGDRLLRRNSDHTWTVLTPWEWAGQPIVSVAADVAGGVFVATRSAVWQVEAGGRILRRFPVAHATAVLSVGEDRFFVATWDAKQGRVVEVRDGLPRVRLTVPARPMALVWRRETVWVSFSRLLAALGPGGSSEVIAAPNSIGGGGPLLVDQEGSLWLGTVSGLVQFLEPDAVAWNQADGLPSAHTRFLRRGRGEVWVVTTEGLGRMVQTARGWRARSEGISHRFGLCADREERLWLLQGSAFVSYQNGDLAAYPEPGLQKMWQCSPSADGTVWLATNLGLFRTPSGPGAPRRAPGAPRIGGKPAPVKRVLEDSLGQVWVRLRRDLCRAPASSVAEGTASWVCESLSGAGEILSLAEVAPGRLWVATSLGGVYHTMQGRWTQIPGSRDLPSPHVLNLVPARQGGMWLLGPGFVRRVAERLDLAQGWEVVEEVSISQGVPGGSTWDLVEEPDGRLWLATDAGVALVPMAARRARGGPPPIALVKVTVNGKSLPPGRIPILPYRHNQIELHFAALSFADRGRLLYQARLNRDAPWSAPASGPPVFRFLDLPSGDYLAEVRASLDGQNWTPRPAALSFRILRPWYLEPWALVCFAAMLGLVLYAVHRIRMEMELRLERQRTTMAMDLHDDMGSGLGSVGILAGLAADPHLPESKRVAIAGEIAKTTGELASALGEIVWSLRPESARLEIVTYHIVERASGLLAGNGTSLETAFPERWPEVELPPLIRRNLVLIASEALHNAARHAHASQVELGLAPSDGRWKLWIADNGRGMPREGGKNHQGMGLASMQERAKRMGASLFRSSGSGGTTVTLVFDLRARDRRSLARVA